MLILCYGAGFVSIVTTSNNNAVSPLCTNRDNTAYTPGKRNRNGARNTTTTQKHGWPIGPDRQTTHG